jgi:hypothetical protein
MKPMLSYIKTTNSNIGLNRGTMLSTLTIVTMLWLIAGISVAHYFADFVLQSRWMGENKSKEWKPLLVHIAVYTSFMAVVCFFLLGPIGLVYAVLNGALHLVTDYFSSRMSRKAYEEGKLNKFWLIIGADQLIHHLCLVLTLLLF